MEIMPEEMKDRCVKSVCMRCIWGMFHTLSILDMWLANRAQIYWDVLENRERGENCNPIAWEG